MKNMEDDSKSISVVFLHFGAHTNNEILYLMDISMDTF